MRLLVILTVAVLLVVAIEGQQRVCEPRSVFKVDCNTCRCDLNGTGMSCTRKQCNTERRRPDSRRRNQKICEPGSFFTRACNTCRCNDDGTNAACTLKGCI